MQPLPSPAPFVTTLLVVGKKLHCQRHCILESSACTDFSQGGIQLSCAMPGAGLQLASAQLFPVEAPYFYQASQHDQSCRDVCSNGGVTDMTSYFFTGFYDNQVTSLCSVLVDGQWIPGSQRANSTTCSVLLDHSAGNVTAGMACACISTTNSVGLADPRNYSTCADACYNSPYGQGASIPGASNAYACVSSANVGTSNAFGNVVLNSTTGSNTCLTADLSGGAGASDPSYSCACVYPTPFRRKLQLHRKFGQATVASA